MNTSDPTRATVPNGLNERNDESRNEPRNIEDAILLTGHGKFHWFLSVSCGLCLVAMIAELFGTAFLIPAAQCEFAMGSSEKGLLNAVAYIGMISSSHLWGYLADTRGRRKVLLVSLVLDAVCGFLSSVAHTYWLFAALRFFNGFFVCAASAVVFVYLGEFHSGLTRSRAIMHMSVFLSIGTILDQGLAWLIIPQNWALNLPWLPLMFRPWRLFVILNSIPSIITALLLFLLPESPKFLLTNAKDKEAVDVLRHMFSINTGRNIEEYPVEYLVMDKQEIGPVAVVHAKTVLDIIKSMWAQTKPLFQRPNLLLTVIACMLQFLLFASFNGFAVWLPDLYSRLALYSEANPNHTLTICDVVAALADNSVAAVTSIRSTDIDTQTHSGINNLTYTELMKTNSTVNVSINPVFSYAEGSVGYDVAVDVENNISLVDMFVATNGTWFPNNTATTLTCSSTVSQEVFRNTLAVGIVCAIVYTCAGYLVDCISGKRLMVASTVTSSVTGVLIVIANSELLIVMLSSVFIAMSGVCVNLLNNIVIDSIPTQLRAMAVCLSLMSGRLGVTVCSLVLGVMLDYACTAAIFLLSGTVLVCCFLTCLLPGPSKSTH